MSNETLFGDFKLQIDNESIDPENAAFWILQTAIATLGIWVIFTTFYFPRVVGLIISFVLNRLLRRKNSSGHVKVGSFSVSLLAGKIMFKDLVYANEDFSLRVNDAWIIFSYWRNVPCKEISYDETASRLHLSLNGFQLHWFNRVDRYKEIAKLFKLGKIFEDEAFKREDPQENEASDTRCDRLWALFGIIRLDIWSGRCVVGNALLPYMFDLSWENLNSEIKLCESPADRALISVEGHMESVKGSFLKHPDYEGPPHKDPPRTMGEGFDVLQSATVNFFYRQDMLGFVTTDRQTTNKDDRPVWESIWRFGPNTTVSYGPWVDEQRALICKFFFPPDYQTAPVTELPCKGQRRIHVKHEVRISFLKESSIDIWFLRGEQLESIRNRCQAGSTIDLSLWCITTAEGCFNWSAKGSLLNVVSTTSLLYRNLFQCETLRIDAAFHYPRKFNAKQTWRFKYNITKGTMWFVWDHKRFFTDLIKEWKGDAPADLLQFIPYEVHTDLAVSDGFEVIMLLNNGNWVDPSEVQSENVETAIVGEKLTFSFLMSFVDFLPETHKMKYTIIGENDLAMRMKYPANSATAPLLAMLQRAAHTTSNAPKSTYGTHSNNEKWHECWRTEKVSLAFDYKYYPYFPPVPTSIPPHLFQEFGKLPPKPSHPKDLPCDHLGVFIDFDGSEVQFTGILIRFILDLKDNYFGFHMTDIKDFEAQTTDSPHLQSMFNRVPPNSPVEFYRSMDVDVDLRVHNIRAHCLSHSLGAAEPEPCPVLYTEELAVEIKKTFSEMMIQVAVGQCAVHFERASTYQSDGFLSLSGLQFRAQACLSPVDVPWDMAIIEYAWQIEILVGELRGSLELPSHLMTLAQTLETLLVFALAKDDEKTIPKRFSVCQHGQLTTNCTKSSKQNRSCEGEGSLKYKHVRVSVDGIRLALCEDRSIIDVTVDPLRFAVCNGHEGRFTDHISVRVPSICIRQVMKVPNQTYWLEVAKVAVAGVSLDIQLPLSDEESHLEKERVVFIRKHDSATRRLHFLYSENKAWECACFGKTRFFAQSDTLGKEFFINTDSKLFVPKINEAGQQPSVLQSILRPTEKILRCGQYRVYPDSKRTSHETLAGSLEAGLFHSALSHQKDKRLSKDWRLMAAYSQYLSQLEVSRPQPQVPKIGLPGALGEWAMNKLVRLDLIRRGMDEVQIQSALTLGLADAMGPSQGQRRIDVPCCNMAITGNVAHSIEIFVSPLSIEILERLISSAIATFLKLSPATFIQHTYLNCALKRHRQPLTENLFSSIKKQIKVEVSLNMPRMHVSLFHCGTTDNHQLLSDEAILQSVPTNMCVILFDGITITSASERGLSPGLSFSLNCSAISSQLLQLVFMTDSDFSSSRTPFRSSLNWPRSEIGARNGERELRVIVEAHIPEVVVTLEEKDRILLFQSNADHLRMPDSVMNAQHNVTKISFGGVKILVVMARALEKTAKHEFPLYDVMAPAITAWLNVAQRMDTTLDKLSETINQWADLSFARMMKLALECGDETILGPKGKNVMDCAKLLGRHQNSCPSCLLLKILMRWYCLPESSTHLHTPLAVRGGLATEKARKTALMALLSHWHPKICKMVKLASNSEAGKYRQDPTQKKEVRINMEGNEEETRDKKNGSTASGNLPSRDQEATSANQATKSNLYSYIRSAHRERNERKEGKKSGAKKAKDYVNPMDILPQAFFYSFYRSNRLDWTLLDGVPLNELNMQYDLVINQISIDLVEPKLLSSKSTRGSQLAPCLHHLVSVRKVAVSGGLSWKIEMDEKNLMPIRGRAHLGYCGQIEGVQFVFAIASVHLAKEVILVVKSAGDTLNELRNAARPGSMDTSLVSVLSGTFDQQTWDEKVFDMMKDFEKNVQRGGSVQRGDVLAVVQGQLTVADVRLETRLTDLYVSFDMKSAELLHEHNPAPVNEVSVLPHETVLRVGVKKAQLNILQSLAEGAKSNESKQILHCGLQESKATLVRKHVVVEGLAPKVDTSLDISLGSIEGELPMSAGSLHDVVMKHGPQLEMEFDRLSAHPQSTQANNSAALIVDVTTSVDQRAPPPVTIRQKATPSIRVMFSFELKKVELKARILPSLLVMYRMRRASSTGETGNSANWVVAIEQHWCEFHVSRTDKPKDMFALELPAIDFNGHYLGEDDGRNETGDAPATSRSLHYRKGGYLKMLISLGRVSHSFTTELLNHILFAEQSFRTELSSLVARIEGQKKADRPVVVAPPSVPDKTPFLFFLTIKGTSASKEPWLQLTASTPTATAVRFTIDSFETELTNRWVVKEAGSSREGFFGRAVLQCSAKLGQLVKIGQEIPAELQEYATFMTQIRVESKEGSKQTHSYHIAVIRPILMIKTTAIDKAILVWLNCKNTYDYWREERACFEKSSVTESKRQSVSQKVAPHIQPSQDSDFNLSLSIDDGMYVCMPLISHDTTDGLPALVLSLQKSDVSVSIKKELACQAQFHGFRLNFIDNFDEQSLMDFEKAAAGETMSNFFFCPQGSYKLCSRVSNESGDAKWVLSVRSNMGGMIIDLDQRIGKMVKMLMNTISSLGEEDENGGHSDHQPDSDEDLIDGADELAAIHKSEQRIRWMEQKMHEQARLLADLVLQKASELQLEAERKKLRQFELLRFKEFRRTMVEKLRRSNHDKGAQRPSAASFSHIPITPKISAVRSEQGEPLRVHAKDVVNMHVDVQVQIESGACTFRTAPRTDPSQLTKNPSPKDLRSKNLMSPAASFAKFSIPSMDLKGYYMSGLHSAPPPSFPMTSERPNLNSKEKCAKRGCFSLAVDLASMPSETVVTPHLADFLEQVLEPLPMPVGVRPDSIPEGPETMANIVAIDTSVLPLDVIFHLAVQSSTIRFDGQQQRSSAADCLLKLPSLTLMGSTGRADGAEYPGGVDISVTLSDFSLSIYSPHQQSRAHDALSLTLDHISFVVSRSKNASAEADNRVRFVLTSTIGTANFNYDMRRLSELLAFPKPWFRKSIAKRVFFGDQTGTATPAARKQSTATKNIGNPNIAMEKPWSAKVLLNVQWKELKVNAQMSNTMGTANWNARNGELRSLSKLNSRHERDVTVTFKLDGSGLTAQGGAISGEVSLKKLGMSLTHQRFDKKPPRNQASIKLGSFATKIEWMSRIALIGRCEEPSITLGDDFTEVKNSLGEVNRVAVGLNIKCSWSDLQVVITKTTIEDFIRIVHKLNTFFSEQLKDSRLAWKFDEELGLSGSVKKAEEENEKTASSYISHWQNVLDVITDIQYGLKLLVLPKNGETVVGGTVELEAGRCSLACMHGEMNANSWAVFHLRNPSILFSPEAQFHFVDKAKTVIGVSVRQRLIIRLGDVPTSADPIQTESMANVSRVQQGRNSVMKSNASIASSLDYLIGDVLKQIGLAPSAESTVSKSQHSVLELFQFPALEAVLTSVQSADCDPDKALPNPELHSSFICEFHSQVYVQTDFNAQVSFLPELLKSYIHVEGEQAGNAEKQAKEEMAMTKDTRVYLCDNWVVDPKIRFIDRFKWNPPVIDEVLRKLQIFDHRTTIPKALQRAVLDPLDAVLANGILQMLRLVDRSDETDSSKIDQ